MSRLNPSFRLLIPILLCVIASANCLSVLNLFPAESLQALQISVDMNDFVLQSEWQNFKKTYNKNYRYRLEEAKKMAIFKENLDFIRKHNARFDKGEVTFSMKVNQFADLTNEEFVKTMNGYRRNSKNFYIPRDQESISDNAVPFLEPENVQLPAEMDWRKKGAVTAVKNQGQCGSCWAFSATGSLEGQHFRINGTLSSLSEQNLVDCSSHFGNMGCDGGLMDNAFKYIKFNHGIDTEQSYPYKAVDGRCHFDPASIGADDAGFVDIPKFSEQKLQVAVATVGPISVAIDASNDSFRFYHKGIYYEPRCSSLDLDHGILAVGYGTDETTKHDYWLVKNSWGETWGDSGYIKMSRNRGNNCGIASAASYPVVKKN